jgi:hypothetical protein
MCALACSWCWVIGMVFPAFTIADFGNAGWLVFVVPNVIGATSVGFLLRSSAQARRFAQTHRAAIRAFTLVTVAFHGFVVATLVPWVGYLKPAWAAQIGVVLLGAGVIAVCARTGSLRGFVRAGMVIFALSALLLVAGGFTTGWETYAMPPETGAFAPPALLFALVGTTLGFLTCPFLDATFLRLRAAIDNPGKAAGDFSGAFSGPFLLLVAMTALYATGFLGEGVFSYYIVAHIVAQALYTCAFHAWAHRAANARTSAPVVAWLLGGALALAWPHLASFRVGYELLLSAYALPFPAYVWIVCVWAKRPTPRAMMVWSIAVVAAGPLFAMGYLGKRWELIPLAAAVVVAAPALLALRALRRRVPGV